MFVKKLTLIAVALAAFSSTLKAADDKPWKNVTEASFVSANGNSKAHTASGKNTFSYVWNKLTTLELIGGGLGSKSEGSTTAEQYYASEKLSHKVTDRNYVFQLYRWDKDRFAGIRNRHDGSVGAGREFFKREKDLLIGEAGGGYISEERVNARTNGFASGRLYSKYTRTISETASFSQDGEYIHNFEDGDDFRVKTETSLLAALSAHLSLKVSYVWKHVGQPPLGIGRNDTITTVGLVATY